MVAMQRLFGYRAVRHVTYICIAGYVRNLLTD